MTLRLQTRKSWASALFSPGLAWEGEKRVQVFNKLRTWGSLPSQAMRWNIQSDPSLWYRGGCIFGNFTFLHFYFLMALPLDLINLHSTCEWTIALIPSGWSTKKKKTFFKKKREKKVAFFFLFPSLFWKFLVILLNNGCMKSFLLRRQKLRL